MTTQAEALDMITNGLAMAEAGRAALAAALKPPGVTVASLADLLAALKAAQAGDVVTLAPGDYGALVIDRIAAPGVIVAAAGAKVPSLRLSASKGITVRDLIVSGAPGAYCGQITGCEGVAIEGGEFSGGRMGVVVQRSNGVVVRGARFHHLSADGINVSGTSNILIEGNSFTDFVESGDHRDAIQFMTTGTTASAENITIRGNRMWRGTGALFQGVFITPQAGGLPYKRVTIEGNTVIGAMAHGIGVALAEDVEITGNTVQPIEGLLSRIILTNITRGRVADNRYAMLGQGGTNTGLEILDKPSLKPIAAEEAARL